MVYANWHKKIIRIDSTRGKNSPWESCKRSKFDHTKKWYIHETEPIQENEPNKILRDFEIQTEDRTSVRKSDLFLSRKYLEKK